MSLVVRKLLKRRATIFALCVIAGNCILSLMAYIVAPDHSPNANTMILELGAKAPGSAYTFIKIPKTITPISTSLWQKFWNGSDEPYTLLPVLHTWKDKEYVFVQHYIDDGLTDTLCYQVATFPASGKKAFRIEDQLVKHTFYLGTDRYGRDILSRLLIGSRVTMQVGLCAVLLSLTIGIFLGSIAGYYGGWADNVVLWFINIIYAIPTLLLVFAITLALGKGLYEVFIAIGCSIWTGAARVIRGQVMVIKEMEYITAAKAIGLGNARIIARHILPNISGTIMVLAAGNFATAILAEAGLSFLGFGVQPPQPSWGLMIKENYNFVLAGKPFPALIPGFAIMLLVFAFNMLGNALRDEADVRSKQ